MPRSNILTDERYASTSANPLAPATSHGTFQSVSKFENPTVVNALPAVNNPGAHDSYGRYGMQTGALMAENEAICSGERRKNGCENEENQCRSEDNTLEPEVNNILRALFDTAQNLRTDVLPIGTPTDIEDMKNWKPVVKRCPQTVIQCQPDYSNLYALPADFLWICLVPLQ